jgi:hypothetical protein
MTFLEMLNRGWTFQHSWGQWYIYHFKDGKWVEWTSADSYLSAYRKIEDFVKMGVG